MNTSEDPRDFLQKLSLQRLDKEQQRLFVVKWVAESPNHAVKITRRTAAVEFLRVTERTFERWLHYAHLDGFTSVNRKRAKSVPVDLQAFITDA